MKTTFIPKDSRIVLDTNPNDSELLTLFLRKANNKKLFKCDTTTLVMAHKLCDN